MAIPAKPTLTTPPIAPVRGEDQLEFSVKANNYVAFIGTNVTDLNAAIDWQNTVFTAIESDANSAAQSVLDAADQVALAAGQVTLAEGQVVLAADQVALAAGQVSLAADEVGLAAEQVNLANSAQALSEEWATSLLVVSGGLRGAKYYADVAESAVSSIPEGTINDNVVGTNVVWSSEKLTAWTTISTSQVLGLREQYAVEFTSGPLTLTLPATPSANDYVQFYKKAGFSKGSTIARNGKTIMGLSENLTINTEATALYLVYSGNDWRIVR